MLHQGAILHLMAFAQSLVPPEMPAVVSPDQKAAEQKEDETGKKEEEAKEKKQTKRSKYDNFVLCYLFRF